MKTDTILSILSLAPLAWSSPLPFVLVDLAPAAHHPPAPVRSGSGQRLPHFISGSSKHAGHDDDDEASTQKPIDNRPISPSRSVVPSVALASPQPVVTTYLLSLATGRPRADGKADAVVVDGAKATKDAIAAVQGSTSAQMEMGIAQGQGQGHSESETTESSKTAKKISLPCYLAHLRTDYTDMLAVGLVALFLIIIVVVETWDAICQSARDFAHRQGPIRLESDERLNEKRGHLSIRAPPAAELDGSRTYDW